MKNFYLLSGLLVITLGIGFVYINREYIDPRKKAQAMLVKGRLLLEQETDEAMRKAIEEFTTVASHFPDTLQAREALFHLAESYERLGMRDVALGKYKKLVEQKLPDDMLEQAKFKIAKLQIMRSYTDEGMAQLMQLLSATRDAKMRSEIYTEIGRFYAKEGKLAAAQKNYQIALSEYPDNKDAKILLAKSLTMQGKDAQAHGVYEDYLTFQGSLDNDKNKVAVDYRQEALKRGLKHMQEGNYAEAIKFFQTIEERFPDTSEAEDALYFMGNAYMKAGDNIKAIQAFNKAVGNQPRHRDEASFLKKGEAYYNRKDYAKAAAMFQYVQKQYPKGKYFQIAADWEEECRRAMTEGVSLADGDETPDSNNNLTIEEPTIESSGSTEKAKSAKSNPPVIETDTNKRKNNALIEQIINRREPTLEDDKIGP